MGSDLHRGEFAEDDYEEVNERYFRDMLRERRWAALPAGWHNPHSMGAELFVGPRLTPREHQQYALDEGLALGGAKEAILGLVSHWESRSVRFDELTLCPSVSCANLTLLCAMKRRGIERIVFETPAYFATAEQARLLGFAVERVPSMLEDQFDAPLDIFAGVAGRSHRSAVWLTQPRFGIGTNQSIDRLRALGGTLGRNHVLVVDEAGEQKHPSHLSNLSDLPCDLVRTRGLIKGVGLNGLRISMILHPMKWRDDLERVLETAGASIDRYSLASAVSLAESAPLLPSMLKAANDQVRRFRAMLASMLVGGWATPTPLENSYIGSVLLDLRDLPGTYRQRREALLLECRRLSMPIVLRASIGFAYDPDWEAIRMNYFTPEENVAASGRLLDQAYAGVRRRLARA